MVAIDAVDVLAEHKLTGEDALSAGHPDRVALLKALSRYGDGDIDRIRLHLAGPDPRIALRERADLTRRGHGDPERTVPGQPQLSRSMDARDAADDRQPTRCTGTRPGLKRRAGDETIQDRRTQAQGTRPHPRAWRWVTACCREIAPS